MKKIDKELFTTYIKANVSPMLIDFMEANDIPDAVIIPANIKQSELVGHYDKEEYVAPKWYNELTNNKNKVLVIDKIDSIKKEEQTKFVEILEYKKISTFELPKNVVIFVTADIINNNTINEEIYSLVAHIEG